MSRPSRLRRPPAKYVKEDNPPEVNQKPSPNSKPQKDSKKGKNDPLNALRSPILRDRTNLTIELVKVDHLIKSNDKDQLKMPEEVKEKRGMRTRAQDVKTIVKKSGNSQEKIGKNSEEKETIAKKSGNSQEKIGKNSEEKEAIKETVIKKSENSQEKIAKNSEEKEAIKKSIVRKTRNSQEKIEKNPEEKEEIKKQTIAKKSGNSQERIAKNSEGKEAIKETFIKKLGNSQAKMGKNSEEKESIKKQTTSKKSANSQEKIMKNSEEKEAIEETTVEKSADSPETIEKIPEEKEVIKKTTLKKSANFQEKIGKNPAEKEAIKKTVKRQVPSKSSKKSEVQVIEEEPKESPDVEKPSKITRTSRIPRKTLKSDLTPSTTDSAPETQESRSKPVSTSSKRPKSTRPSVVINKPPPKPPKTSKTPPKPEKRASRRLSTKFLAKSPKKSEKKFFKARKNVTLTHSKVSPMKRGMRNPRQLKSRKSPSIYQPTLKESFARAKKLLRPRKIDKNYNEDSKIAKIDEKSKGPVYKNLKIGEESPKDKNQVYEFSFDVNDSNERFRKKRKKRTVRKAPAKRAKIVQKPAPLPEDTRKKNGDAVPVSDPSKPLSGDTRKKNGGAAPVSDPSKPLPEETRKKTEDVAPVSDSKPLLKDAQKKNKDAAPVPDPPTPIPDHPKENFQQNPLKPNRIFDRIDEVDENFNENDEINHKFQRKNSAESQDQVPEPFEVVVDVHEAPDSPPSPNIDIPDSQNPSKPKIVSTTRLEGAKRISLTSTPLNSEIKPRACPSTFSNRPSSQYRTMMNHSLIRRSFSPIVKEQQEKFDASSPWRPVVVSTGFSRVKNIFQSTPQGRKHLTSHGINSLTTDNKGATMKINKIVEKNDSSVVESPSPIKSPRKFGTVLSNVSPSPTKAPTMLGGFDNSINSINSINSPKRTSGGKENADENSPVKSPVKKIKAIKEMKGGFNFEPKPGPSGLQKSAGILRQSNLNDFLNIPEMPEGTSIVTAHGIFDDNEGATVGGRGRRNLGDFSVGNAFGFDEESTFEDFGNGSVEKKGRGGDIVEKVRVLKVQKVQKKVEPTRLPAKRVEREESPGEGEEEDEERIEVAKTKKHAEATKSDVVEAVHFLDTFDAEERETSPVEVPLFVDPEPVHFVQPPRYSYSKRKRAVKFNTSDETEHSDAYDSDDDENHVKHKNKKRKMTKAQREQQKKLDDWAKSVNQTFDEIEHFDLLVE